VPTLTPVPTLPEVPAPTPRAGALSRPVEAPAVPVPPSEAPKPAVKPAQTSEALQEQLDRALAHASSSLRFRVDEIAQRVVVSVLDAEGEVVMQIPDEAALAIAHRLARTGALLDEQA